MIVSRFANGSMSQVSIATALEAVRKYTELEMLG